MHFGWLAKSLKLAKKMDMDKWFHLVNGSIRRRHCQMGQRHFSLLKKLARKQKEVVSYLAK